MSNPTVARIDTVSAVATDIYDNMLYLTVTDIILIAAVTTGATPAMPTPASAAVILVSANVAETVADLSSLVIAERSSVTALTDDIVILDT